MEKIFSKIQRRWGHYIILLRLRRICIKLLCFRPGGKLSYQRHLSRSELWIPLSQGPNMLAIGYERLSLEHSIRIPPGAWHQFVNLRCTKNFWVLEIQYGHSVTPTDITRQNDVI